MRRLNAMSAIVLLSITLSARTGLSHQASLHDSLTRTVFVSVVNKSGMPVTDLSADDFVIKEGGKDREIVGAGMTTMPLRIAIVVDDNGTGIFRYALVKFVERLQGRAEFALSTVQGQHLKLLDYTSNLERVSGALNQLNARPATNDGGQLLEGIFETAKDFQKRRTQRPIIVVLTVGGEEHSTLPAQHVLDELEKSGAALNVIAIHSSALRAMVTVSKPSALLDSNLNLSEVLGDGPKQSGGKRDEIVAAPGIVTGLQELAEALRNQYAVSFSRPDRPKDTEKLSVSVKRAGLTVRAPVKLRPAN